MPRDHIRERTYTDQHAGGGFPFLKVDETRPGAPSVRLAMSAPAIDLDAEACEQLGIDLQIRASYLRGVRPPPGPEPERAPGPDDVPLIPDPEEPSDDRDQRQRAQHPG